MPAAPSARTQQMCKGAPSRSLQRLSLGERRRTASGSHSPVVVAKEHVPFVCVELEAHQHNHAGKK